MSEKIIPAADHSQEGFDQFVTQQLATDKAREWRNHGGRVNVNLAVPKDGFNLLLGLTIVDDVSLAAEMRTALAYYIQRRRESPQLEAQIARRRQECQHLLPPPVEDGDNYAI